MTYDLYVVCGLVGYMYLWHKSMSTSMQFVHVSKAILKGGGKKVWLPNWKRNASFGHEDACINKKGCWFVVKGEFGASNKGKIILPSYPWV